MLVFDIETMANEEAKEFEPVFKPPSNYKDEEKILAHIQEQREEWISKMALDPDYGIVRAIGIGNASEFLVLIGDEAETISEFWDIYQGGFGKSCGYNIIGFDFPFLLRRSMALGIKVPNVPDLRKYGNANTLDLMNILYPDRAKGLKWVCKRYGINNPLPDLDGSQVATMDDGTVMKYVMNDVMMTTELFNKMSGVYF